MDGRIGGWYEVFEVFLLSRSLEQDQTSQSDGISCHRVSI